MFCSVWHQDPYQLKMSMLSLSISPSDHAVSVPERPDGVSFRQHASVPGERPQHNSSGTDDPPCHSQHHHHRPGSRLHPHRERPGWDDASPPQRAELTAHGQPPQPAGEQHMTPCRPRSSALRVLRLHTCTTAIGCMLRRGGLCVCVCVCVSVCVCVNADTCLGTAEKALRDKPCACILCEYARIQQKTHRTNIHWWAKTYGWSETQIMSQWCHMMVWSCMRGSW